MVRYIVTLGYGPGASGVGFVVTLGYASAEPASPPAIRHATTLPIERRRVIGLPVVRRCRHTLAIDTRLVRSL